LIKKGEKTSYIGKLNQFYNNHIYESFSEGNKGYLNRLMYKQNRILKNHGFSKHDTKLYNTKKTTDFYYNTVNILRSVGRSNRSWVKNSNVNCSVLN